MSGVSSSRSTSKRGEPRQSKGQASRATILLAAARLATLKGLDGLSIGDLAAEVGMSKSGLYAHFKSKAELELATIETAAEVFDREVLQPAIDAPAGCQRLRAFAGSFLAHLERRVFPGGCFFVAVAAELSARPGPALDQVVEVQQKWLSLLMQCLLDGQTTGEISARADLSQAVFEIEAMLLAGNLFFLMTKETVPLAQALSGVDHVLARLAVSSESKKERPPKDKRSSAPRAKSSPT